MHLQSVTSFCLNNEITFIRSFFSYSWIMASLFVLNEQFFHFTISYFFSGSIFCTCLTLSNTTKFRDTRMDRQNSNMKLFILVTLFSQLLTATLENNFFQSLIFWPQFVAIFVFTKPLISEHFKASNFKREAMSIL